MMKNKFFVFDTNALISAFLLSASVSRKALNRATEWGTLAVSEPLLQEFSGVLFRKKFDKYFLNEEERLHIIDKLISNAALFLPAETITACRDADDNMILELAVTANAACIVTGDKALLELHPFRGIAIVNATDFLLQF